MKLVMKHIIPIFFLLSGLLGSGCSQKEVVSWVEDGHPFAPPEATTGKEPAVTGKALEEKDPLPEEKPIVRIINGTEVAGLDEAENMITGKQINDTLGLRTPIDQLALTEVPLIQVAATLSELSGYNIAVSQEASGVPVSLYLQDIPLRQALEAICRLNDLWYREDERIVTLMTVEEYSREMVIRRNEKSRAYWLRYTNANDMAKILQAVMSSKVQFRDIGSEEVYGHVNEKKEAGEKLTIEEENASSSGSGKKKNTGRMGTGGGNLDLNGFDADEIKKLLVLDKLQTGIGDALSLNKQIEKDVPTVITVFKRNNSILARSLDETILEDIGRIIELMDTPTSQVLLEMSILQINLADGFESFFQFDLLDTGKFVIQVLPATTGITGKTLNVLFGNDDIAARMQLYARDDRLKTISTPYLMSANNSKVEFFVGQEVPLRDDVESKVLYNDKGEVTTTTFEVKVKRKELGTDINISSFINEDGTITMDMQAEISSPQYNLTSIGVVNNATGEVVSFPLDGVERSKLTSIITAASGQTIAIGGIIREELSEYENRVPVLGEIPVLGFFFKEVHDLKQKTETVILLTPHIIRHPERGEKTSREFMGRKSSHPRFSHDQERILDYPVARDNKEKTSTGSKEAENGPSNQK
jgi:type II secretory pathway component GspD/PulD (secretin)